MFSISRHLTESPIFEDLTPRETYHFVICDELDENGDFHRKFTFTKRLSNVPFTPQSGVGCLTNDLTFLFSRNLNVSHDPVLLSVSANTNPLETARFVQKQASELGAKLDNYNKKER